MTQAELQQILAEHAKWLVDRSGTGAVLTGADLTGAVLTGAVLTGAVLTGADLTGADLTGADLTGADLTGADLTGAVLTGAVLTGADLTGVKEDVHKILSGAPHEAPAVLAALREGRVDGSTYSGECACLVGTIANARPGARLEAVKVELGARPDRPAEMFFSAIRAGDTPATNPACALAAEWVEEWLKEHPAPAPQQ